MHPRLVAGAWVGFNDSRVTMRSDYWGQGGHNAILLVGDFFRDALREGWVDARARFASPQSAQAVMASWPSVGEREGASIARLEVQPDAHAENAAPPEDAPPKSSQELDQLLQTLSRRDGWSSGGAATGAGISTSPLQ
jgi:penicillin-binding protein 1A